MNECSFKDPPISDLYPKNVNNLVEQVTPKNFGTL